MTVLVNYWIIYICLYFSQMFALLSFSLITFLYFVCVLNFSSLYILVSVFAFQLHVLCNSIDSIEEKNAISCYCLP